MSISDLIPALVFHAKKMDKATKEMDKAKFEHESERLREQMAARKAERQTCWDKMDITKKLRSYNPTSGYARVMNQAADEIDRLRDWIREHGKQTDTCTRHILGEVCEDCRCGKS